MQIYENDEQVGLLTRRAFEQTGSKLLQIHRLAETDEEHVETLLNIFNPRPNELIADVGCGVGRLAEMMQEQRHDLLFILINRSASQLAMCPPEFTKLQGMAEDLPIKPPLKVDAIMATYVLGHVDLPVFVSECVRVLERNGRVYIYDLFKRDDATPCRLKHDLDYAERTVQEMIDAFRSRGFAKVGPTHSTYFVPEEIEAFMPRTDTLRNTVSAALVFRKIRKTLRQ
jgi:ubiquinone/menaquinone biosynthesis C-methylase UbiE